MSSIAKFFFAKIVVVFFPLLLSCINANVPLPCAVNRCAEMVAPSSQLFCSSNTAERLISHTRLSSFHHSPLVSLQLHRVYSFLDYIMGGCQIHFTVI